MKISEAITMMQTGQPVFHQPTMVLPGQFYWATEVERTTETRKIVVRNRDGKPLGAVAEDAKTETQTEIFDEKGTNFGNIKTFLMGKAHQTYAYGWMPVNPEGIDLKKLIRRTLRS